MENCLEIATKTFPQIEKIHLLEFIDNDEKLFIVGEDSKNKLKFIIWDIYRTDKVDIITPDNFLTIKDLGTRLTRLAKTSGNLLTVDDEGKVRSVLKEIELERKRKQPDEITYLDMELTKKRGKIVKNRMENRMKSILYISIKK